MNVLIRAFKVVLEPKFENSLQKSLAFEYFYNLILCKASKYEKKSLIKVNIFVPQKITCPNSNRNTLMKIDRYVLPYMAVEFSAILQFRSIFQSHQHPNK